MSRLDEMVEAYSKAIKSGGERDAMKAAVKTLFWSFAVAEMSGRRNGKMALIGELTESSEAVASTIIESILNGDN